MAEAAYGRRLTLPTRESVIEWVLPRSDALIVASLMAIAFALRMWGLGDMALHHDESLHAQYSWYLYSGDGYTHNPLMHGPFLFHSAAAVFFLFGDTDMTARLLPAVFGAVLVGMPYLLRRQIGMPAVIIAAVLLMFSPTLLYYGRFLRNDIYIAVWTFGMVICMWRYLDDLKAGWLYGLAALMALSFATKEVTFITVAIMLVFVDLMLAVELGKRRAGETIAASRVALRTLAIVPVAWLIAGLWLLVGHRWKFGLERLPPAGDLMVILGTLSLPQFAAGIQALPFVGDRGYDVSSEDALRIATVASLLLASLYVGLAWRAKVWLIAAAFFFVPFVLLYTTFFTNIDGFFSGIWGSLDYWLDQHHVKRGNQPTYYYALLTPLYEFLPLIAGAAGAAWLALRGDWLRRWFVFWLAGTFLGLTLAGEKMPWLETHIALPLVLVAAMALAGAIDRLQLRGTRWLSAAGVAAVTAAAVLLILEGDGALDIAGYALLLALAAYALALAVRDGLDGVIAGARRATASRELLATLGLIAGSTVLLSLLAVPGFVDPWFAIWAVALAPVVLVGYAAWGAVTANPAFGRAVFAIAVAGLMTLTVRAGLTASFTNNDTPVELLVYTQTSPDIPVLRDRIDALAESSGLGHNLPVVVDSADSFAWPWAWYLRNYHDVTFTTVDEGYEPPPNAVLLVSRSNTSHVDASAYSQTPYKHRWWFNETYRGLNFREATDVLTDAGRRSDLVSFFFHRRAAETNTGSIDGVAFFPNDLSAFDDERGPPPPPREPTVQADGRIVIGSVDGSPGPGVRGELWQPAGMAVDAQGNLWVADGRNNRVQKFDAQGRFITEIGGLGAEPGNFNEPWGVAVDAEGFVYVADTWNHRIQKFSPELEFLMSWGTLGTTSTDPLTFYGPRDIAIAPDGTLWVTDTGNQRVLHFSKDGEPLDASGAATGDDLGYAEPVGLTFGEEGGLLVADAWNGRVLRFDAVFDPQGDFETGWMSRDILDKPYIAVLADGRVLVTAPETGSLLLFDATGERIGAWRPSPDSKPVGIVAMAGGGFAFSDVTRNEVQIVPGALVAELFE